MSVRGRAVLITGASSGIGAASAAALAAAGARTVLLGRDPTRLAEVAARTRVRPVVADLGTTEGMRATDVALVGLRVGQAEVR